MTREEALNKAINIVRYFEANFAKSKEAREDAVNIIKALEQEPCEDAISRQAVLELVNADWKYDGLEQPINNLPSVTPTRKVCKWICKSHGFPPEPLTVCSICGFDRDLYIRIRGFDKIKFCPNCGAKMESEVEE